MGKKSANQKSDSSGANLGFGAKLWLTADKLRNNMDAAEYKHVVLGLLFLKYISDSFQSRRDGPEAEVEECLAEIERLAQVIRAQLGRIEHV